MLVSTKLRIPEDFLRLTKVAEEAASGLAKYARSTESFLNTFNSFPTRSLLQQASAALLLPRSAAVEDLASLANRNYRVWNDIAESNRWLEKGIVGIDARMHWIESLAQQTETISKWLGPLPQIHDSLVEVTRQIDSSGVLGPDILRLTDGVLRDSAGIVSAANDFFAKEYLRGTSVVSPTEAEETDLQSLEAAEDVHEAHDKSMILLHQAAEHVILVGSDTAISLRDELGVIVDERLKPYKHLLQRLSHLASPKSFLNMLKDFKEVFSREYWRTIWTEPGTRFLPRPESVTKMGLGMYLSGHWNGLAFVGQEIVNGDGFVDLLVNYMGYNYIVELKIVGSSWSIGTAKAGLEQLDAYMENYQERESYLVVFDGRRTSSGEQLDSEYKMSNGVVKVIVVRTYFDSPSR